MGAFYFVQEEGIMCHLPLVRITIRGMKKHRTRKFLRLLVLFAADIILFSFVNPTNAYALVIIVGFVLVSLTLYALIDFLLVVAERIAPFSLHTKRRIALASTIVLSLLLAMQSIGQLTVKDVLAVIPLLAVLAFYFSYATARKAE